MNERQKEIAANALIEGYSLDLPTVLRNIFYSNQLNRREAIEVMQRHLEHEKNNYKSSIMEEINKQLEEDTQ